MTMTSNMYPPSMFEGRRASAGLAVRAEAIFTAPRDDKPWEALQAPANRPPRNCKAVALTVRPDDGILGVARANEDAVIDPLRLDELELPPQMRSDEGEHQPPIGAIVLQNSFREQRAIRGSTPDHPMYPGAIDASRGFARRMCEPPGS